MSEQVFISYRRDGGDAIASLVCNKLKALGYTVFYDYDSLGGGCFDERIFDAIEHCRDFVLILSPHSLDRCVNGDDWVRSEIRAALRHQKNIVPIMLPDFTFPETLPEDIAEITRHNAVPFVMAYLDAVIATVTERFTKDKTAKPVKKKKEAPLTEDDRVAPLLRRMHLFLEDGEFEKGDEYAEKVLDIAPECAEAYVGKLLASLKIKKPENLKRCARPFDENPFYKKALRFADEALKSTLTAIIAHINERNEAARLSLAYDEATAAMRTAKTETAYRSAARLFAALGAYKDAAALEAECLAGAERARVTKALAEAAKRAAALAVAKEAMEAAVTEADYLRAAKLFSALGAYKDAPALAEQCVAEAKRITEEEHQRVLDRAYDEASAAMDAAKTEADYLGAASLFSALGAHKDAAAREAECRARAVQAKDAALIAERTAKMEAEYQSARKRMKNAYIPFQWQELYDTFERLAYYKKYTDAEELAATCRASLEKARAEERRLQNEKTALQKKKNELRASASGKTQLPLIENRVSLLTTVLNLYASSKLDLNANEIQAIGLVFAKEEEFAANCRKAEHYDSYLDTYPLLATGKDGLEARKKAILEEQENDEFKLLKRILVICFGFIMMIGFVFLGAGRAESNDALRDLGILFTLVGGIPYLLVLFVLRRGKREANRIDKLMRELERIPPYTPYFDAATTKAALEKQEARDKRMKHFKIILSALLACASFVLMILLF